MRRWAGPAGPEPDVAPRGVPWTWSVAVPKSSRLPDARRVRLPLDYSRSLVPGTAGIGRERPGIRTPPVDRTVVAVAMTGSVLIQTVPRLTRRTADRDSTSETAVPCPGPRRSGGLFPRNARPRGCWRSLRRNRPSRRSGTPGAWFPRCCERSTPRRTATAGAERERWPRDVRTLGMGRSRYRPSAPAWRHGAAALPLVRCDAQHG